MQSIDAETIYEVPILMQAQGLDSTILEKMGLPIGETPGLGPWRKFLERRHAAETKEPINIALVGNPNCGKTSFFNRATGLRERVGNYSGVTVDAKQGTCHHKGYTINLIDLPGTYSITEYTPEEIYVREFITKHHPDLVLNVVDASCLERNLFLTTQLIDMNIRVVMALNMFDELTNEGSHLDYGYLGQLLGLSLIHI